MPEYVSLDWSKSMIVEKKTKVSKLCIKGLRFERALKVIKKYWKARSSLLHMTCSNIGYNLLERCDNRIV